MTDLPRENVQSYPRPPALEPVPQRITIRLGGVLVAETTRALRVLETHHAPTYCLPPEDIGATLHPASGGSFCEWKGAARYFDVIAGEITAPRAAWAYDRPTDRFAPLARYVAFYAGLMDAAWVGDLRVLPQPGDFYGGWVTPNLDGRIKGAPGTRHLAPAPALTASIRLRTLTALRDGRIMTDYQRPETLLEATTLLAVGPRVVLAGGTDLFPATWAPTLPGPVLDLGALEELRGIDRVGGFLRIGAATSWSEVARAGLPSALTALQQAAAEVGGHQIQNTATVGGNLCNASPAADGVPPLLAVDAEVELASSAGRRLLPLERFLLGPRCTARGPEEILTAVLVPETALHGASTFLKLGARRHLVISIAMAAARLVIEEGRIAEARLALGACGPVATRLPAVEAALVGAEAGPSAAERIGAPAVAAALAPITDMRATAEYRAEAATVLLRRAVTRLVGRPQ